MAINNGANDDYRVLRDTDESDDENKDGRRFAKREDIVQESVRKWNQAMSRIIVS